MREFHKIMFEHEARLKYTGSTIEVFLENSCSLKAVKDIAEAFYIEFGTPSDRIKLESAANNHICLIVPVLDGGTENDSNEIEEAEEEQSDPEYTARILNTALEVLSEHENGLTPTELQQELAKRGVIATPTWIGKVLAESDKALKVGSKWRIKDSAHEVVNQSSWDGWKPLTDKVGYRIDGDEIPIGFKKDGKIETLKRIPYNLLEDLYKALPDEANSADVNAVATAVGIENISSFETYFMRILANEFGGELQRIGRSLVLVKGDA